MSSPHCFNSSSLPSLHSFSLSQTQVLGMQEGAPFAQLKSSVVHVIFTENNFTLSIKMFHCHLPVSVTVVPILKEYVSFIVVSNMISFSNDVQMSKNQPLLMSTKLL